MAVVRLRRAALSTSAACGLAARSVPRMSGRLSKGFSKITKSCSGTPVAGSRVSPAEPWLRQSRCTAGAWAEVDGTTKPAPVAPG